MSSPLLVLERAVELSQALHAAGIPHAFGGALALAFHVADPRGTNDIDVNVSFDPTRPRELFTALPTGILWSDADAERAARDGQVRLLWPLPESTVGRPVPVDLFLPQHALHDVAAARTEQVPMLDTTVPILSATDLTVFKALFDRTKDWADIEELLRYGEVDVDDVLRWLDGIVGSADPRLGRFRAAVDLTRRDDQPKTAAELFRKPPAP